jgi:hypothetical protein
MSDNADTLVQEIRTEFEALLTYVKDSPTATADHVERGLFRRLLALGAHLLLWFFALRAEAYPRTPQLTATGAPLPYFGAKPREYFSVFGKLVFWRPYFYRHGVGSASPLDQELGLGDDCYSDLLREIAEYLGVGTTYAKVATSLAQLLGLELSTQAISQMVHADAGAVVSYYAQQAAPPVAAEGPILVVQADGKGVPIVRETPAEAQVRLGKGEKLTHKKEAVVTGIYTVAPNVRTPEAVVTSLFHPTAAPAPAETAVPWAAPQHKQLWATLAGKDVALARLADQVAARDGAHIQHRVALTDGAEALQTRMQTHCPTFTLILDFIHADEKLWDVANSLLGEQAPERTPWVEQRTYQLLTGQTAQVVADLRQLEQAAQRTPTQRTTLTKVADYFEHNLPYMQYDTYLAQGWPIASGVIEGACRHLVKDRCELSGMRWTPDGVESLLGLRAVAENGDWAAYHQFRKEQRHLRLYGVPRPTQSVLEEQALALPARTPQPAPARRLYVLPRKTAGQYQDAQQKQVA